jgi:dolichol-phosphate mannosyltransferase
VQPDISIVLDFYNAEDRVESVIQGVRQAFEGGDYSYQIVAVQNGSQDRTGEILDSLSARWRELRVVTMPKHKGFGAGILDGLAVASGKALGWMRGDGQVPPEAASRLLRQMNRTCSDVGYVCPRGGGGALNLLVKTLFGFETDDMNGQPKLLTRRVYNSMRLRSRGYFLDAEALLKAHRMGATICRIDVDVPAQTLGPAHVVEFAFKLCRARLQKNDPWGLNATPRNVLSPMAFRRSAAR